MATLRLHPRLGLLFVLLSCADLALTCSLLRYSAGEVYEANGLAAEVLACYGQVGLAVFKVVLMLLAGILVGIVSAYRPLMARRLVAFACLAVGGVVVHSIALWGQLAVQPAYSCLCQDPAVVKREKHRLDQLSRRQADFRAQLKQWIDAVATGRGTVREAVTALLPSRESINPSVMDAYREQMGAKSDAECLAAMVVSGALVVLYEDGSSAARTRAEQLLAAHGPAFVAYLDLIRPGVRSRSSVEEREAVAVARLQATPDDSSLESVSPRERPRFDPGCHPRDDKNPRARRRPQFVSARCPGG